MAQFINSGNTAFGICSICGGEKTGYPKTYSEVVFFNDLGVVRMSDEIVAECGHSGFVTSGNNNIEVDGFGIATSDSQITGDYTATFTDSLDNITQS